MSDRGEVFSLPCSFESLFAPFAFDRAFMNSSISVKWHEIQNLPNIVRVIWSFCSC